jgi:hypothetical protein
MVSASMVPSCVGSGPVRPLAFRFLHPAAALSPQPGEDARVQARWVRMAHAQNDQRNQVAQLCGQWPYETVHVQMPAFPRRRRAQPTTR